jgi:hypothetical protein
VIPPAVIPPAVIPAAEPLSAAGICVVRGNPSAEELAALIAVLCSPRRDERADGHAGSGNGSENGRGAGTAELSAWARRARLETVYQSPGSWTADDHAWATTRTAF